MLRSLIQETRQSAAKQERPNYMPCPTSTKSAYLDLRKDLLLFLNKINMFHTISDKQVSRIFQGQITFFKE